MNEPLRWKVSLTADDLPRLRQQVEWTMQRQNQRFAELSPAARLSVQARQLIAGLVASLGLLVLVVECVAAPREALRHAGLISAAGAFFFFAVLVAIVLPRMRARSKGFAGRMIAVSAARMFKPVAARLPYDVLYQLEGTALQARVEVLNLTRRLDLRRVGLALHAPGVVVLYQRKLSLRPMRMLYLADASQGAALAEALARANVPCEPIDGPLEDYADPGPAAA